MKQVAETTIGLIGETPMVRLGRIHAGPGLLLAKAEFLQPGGSVKDRAARAIVLGARERGDLAPGQAVVEMTSGNMGAGLAVVCGTLGHPLIVVMSAGNSPARAQMMTALGAEVILVPQVDGAPNEVTGTDIAAAADQAREIAAERGAFYVDQFANPDSVRAHEEGTGPEIWQQTGGSVDAFVASVGSGGTFVGTSLFLKQRNPGVRCVAVEPREAAVLAGQQVRNPRHVLQGTGYGLVPPKWQPALADGYLGISDEEAVDYRCRLAVQEGLYVGFSAAANVCAAVKTLQGGDLGPSPTVVTILCDTGLKY